MQVTPTDSSATAQTPAAATEKKKSQGHFWQKIFNRKKKEAVPAQAEPVATRVDTAAISLLFPEVANIEEGIKGLNDKTPYVTFRCAGDESFYISFITTGGDKSITLKKRTEDDVRVALQEYLNNVHASTTPRNSDGAATSAAAPVPAPE